ncbi:MAG: dynamin family protein, partial [Candidatus Eremiobacteraeota bacterium]|nr:dynamin family protein [Candidatus Eremiobacteraeota bacterium]
LGLDETALRERRAEVLPLLQTLDDRAHQERDAVLASGTLMRSRLHGSSDELRDDLERALGQAFDTSDIARLRDRARLHIIVDRVFAHVVEDFASVLALDVSREIEDALARVQSIVPLAFVVNDAAATAFNSEPGTSLWSGDLRNAIAATIVLDAIGGPAIGLVHDISTRFSSRPAGQYMKREMIADLRAEIFPRFATEVRSFADRIGTKLQRVYDDLAERIAIALVEKRDAEVGSIDRAIAARQAGTNDAVAADLRLRRAGLASELASLNEIVDGFMHREEEIAPADPGADAVRLAHADASFDPNAYDRGLRPSRWRVAVLGALRRGKSSLINAFAGKRVLTDDAAGSVRFPIHVRYGERDQAFSLAQNGEWREIAFENASDEAANSPVLLLVPWSLPRELVLVHAPAFDSGDANAEDINVVAASHASEVLCLFSRQLSDRELSLYERVSEFNKPMLFAHTIADNEAPAERRNVVGLAGDYLRERNIAAERIFVVSAAEYDTARTLGRAPAGWNETEALRSTLQAHAETHMARLERLAHASNEASSRERVNLPKTVSSDRSPQGLFARIFGKGR